jgi:hypothetical protein
MLKIAIQIINQGIENKYKFCLYKKKYLGLKIMIKLFKM